MLTFEQILSNWKRYIEIQANSYFKPNDTVQDLKLAGTEGLWVAFNKWDKSKNFGPYAISYIKSYMLNYLQRFDGQIYIPNTHYWQTKNEYITSSLNQSIDFDENLELQDILPSEPILPSIEDKEAVIAQNELIEDLLSELKPKDQLIIKMYYGIGYDFSKNGEQIAETLGCTRQNISSKLKLIHKKLKEKCSQQKK